MFKKKNPRLEEETEEKAARNSRKYSLLRWKNLKQSTSEDEAKFRQQMQENKIGFKDGLAMTLAAFLVIVLPAALILIGGCLLVMLLLGVL